MANFRIDDWGGGITDHYINGQPNESERCDNLLINRRGKLVSRSGSEWVSGFSVANSPRVNGLLMNKARDGARYLFAAREGALCSMAVNDLSLSSLAGSSGKFFNGPHWYGSAIAQQVSWDVWNDHVIAVGSSYTDNDQLCRPVMWAKGPNSLKPDIITGALPMVNAQPHTTGDPSPYTKPAGSSNYLFTAHAEFRYRIGTADYVLRGPTLPLQTITRSAITSAAPLYVNCRFWDNTLPGNLANFNLPYTFFGLGTYGHYFSIKFYRSVNNGTVLYNCGEFLLPSNNTSSQPWTWVQSVFDDSVIVFNQQLYTTGGVLQDDNPPACKYITVVGGSTYYANVTEPEPQVTGSKRPNRVLQSKKNSPFAVPGANYVDVDAPITAMNRVSNFPVVFTADRTFRLEGSFTNTGSGSMRAVEVSSTVGCVSHNSVVRYNGGLFFASSDGFYFTDGFKVQKISKHLDSTYKWLTRNSITSRLIYGSLDTVGERVYWSVSNKGIAASSDECDMILVLHIQGGIRENMSFTTISGGDIPDWNATATLFDDKVWYRGTFKDFIVKHTEGINYDTYWDYSTDLIKKRGIKWDWISSASNMGDNVSRKWVTQFNAIFRNETGLSCVPYSSNDASGDFRGLKEIRFQSSLLWGDLNFTWGDDDLIWRFTGNIIVKRRFPAGTLRCTHKQIRLVKEPTVIIRSDDYGLVDVVKVGSNYFATLQVGSLSTFSTTLIGAFIHFEYDGYDVAHEILDVQDAGLTIKLSTLPAYEGIGQKWLIKGIALDESMSLESIDLNYSPFGEAIPGWQTSDAGGNSNG